jgi:hypothetical protein
MAEREYYIGTVGPFYYDDVDEESNPVLYDDDKPIAAFRGKNILIDSDASDDSEAVRKSQMTTAMAGYVSKTDFPLDLSTLENGDMLFYNAVDEGWQDIAFLDGSSNILLARIPATLTGKDADTVDGIEGAALLKKDGTVALTGDWDIGSGRKIKGDQILARSASGLFLGEDSGTYGVFVDDSGAIQFLGSGGETFEIGIDGEARFQAGLEADTFQTPDYVRLDDTGIGLYRYDGDVDDNPLWLNKVGYNGGTTRYRDLKIGDGKGNTIGFIDGSTGFWAIGHGAATYPLYVKRSSTNLAMLQNTGGTTTRVWITNTGGSGAIDSVNNDLLLRTSGSATEVLRCVNTGGLVGIGTSSPAGKLEVETSTTAAVSTLVLDQNDEDQPFIKFEGTAEAGTTKNVTTCAEATMDYYGYVKVDVGGSSMWIKVYYEV